MLKLLIVDDEEIERKGMEVILKKNFSDIVIEQAKNGKKAVEMVQNNRFDLILMDIKMPGMNGLEAVEKISELQPQSKCIMVTAYDTFEYARKAIQLGVKDYLIKPSKASEIVETIGRVLKEIRDEQISLVATERQRESYEKTLSLVETDVVTQLLFDHVHEVHLNMLVEMLDIRSTNEMFVMVIMVPQRSEHLYSAVKEKVRETRSGWVGALYGNQLPLIIFREPDKSFRSQAIILARKILQIEKQEHEAGWFIGIGSVCHSLEQIRQSYQDSLNATIDTAMTVKYRFFSDVPAFDGVEDEQWVKVQIRELADFIRLGQWEQAKLKIMNMVQHYEQGGTDLLHTQQVILRLLWSVSRVLSDIGVEVEIPLYSYQTSEYRQLRLETGQLLERMRISYVDHYDRLEADTIHQIKQYIIDHSHQDISLESLGRKVGLSPIYISKMFKEKLGINYIDFLTECRIEKAKKMLGDPEKSIKEITFEVGYHEPNYFSKVFKKICHVSPKNYRKTLLGKRD
ncbi:response regulator [Alkalihalobacillus sp. 1P02AB]|uniref:response regulator n=1 Tax=Alkalihalobacillus sp. 1P02AB TaxID=3132260 RepID=UPI0039A60422